MFKRAPLILFLLSMFALSSNKASFFVQEAEIENKIGMKLILIKPGKFIMGVPKTEMNDDNKEPGEREETARIDEDPHDVEITQPFYMGKTEVTQAEYEKVMGKNPSHFKGDNLPVERVSWYDAKEFCAELSKKEGKLYTLPTEAEWEYACRAGTTTTYHFGNVASADKANYDARKVFPPKKGQLGVFRDKTTPVGSFPANNWGLKDMHGNVWEWCEDWYSVAYYRVSPKQDPPGPSEGTSRVMRGGSWFYEPSSCRAAYRTAFRPDIRSYNIGFRVVMRNKAP